VSDVVYLGEIHDNPWHHEFQVQIIEQLVHSGAQPAVGIEMFSNGQTGELMQYVDGAPTADDSVKAAAAAEKRLRSRLGWKDVRQQEWFSYFPLIEQARQNGIPVFGLDLPQGIRSRIVKNGVKGLTPVEQRMVVDTGFNNTVYRQLMQEQFTRSHCGWSEPGLLGRLYETWVARNDAMAIAVSDMLKGSDRRPVVVIVGSGHTRYNMGVVERVQTLNPDVRQINIGFTPVQEGRNAVEEYLDLTRIDEGAARPAYELIWFTPAVDREDPCVKFREQLERHAHGQTSTTE
ncbi:MAG: ChaN family lipoprotein, partial [Gammaproteobacteria bacterium]|nr:ChaN family lipoprotein [Gammaproteobacteria bacterium]